MADIPIDLIGEILCRCPVKSVLRFKTVSPEWLALISSPDFVAQHLRCSRAPILIHVSSRPQPLYQYLLSYGNRSVEPANLHLLDGFPGHDTDHRLEFIGSPNGVICVVQISDIQDFTLWNPATRSSLPIPAPTLIINPETHTRFFAGMGFNSSAGDYKIVRLLERNLNLSDQVEVFSVNSGQWTVSTTHAWRMRMTDASCVVADGVPYWMGTKEVGEGKKRSFEGDEVRLVLFDVVDDIFRTEEFAWEAKSAVTLLGVRNDCLCAMVWDVSWLRFDLWLKEGDGWSRRYAEVEPPRGGLRAWWFCVDRGIIYRKGVGLIVFDPAGVEDLEETTPLEAGLQVTDRVGVLGWKDGLTQIPRLNQQ